MAVLIIIGTGPRHIIHSGGLFVLPVAAVFEADVFVAGVFDEGA